MISLFTLNLYRYYDFDVRLPSIISSISKRNPDVIFFQETQIDEQYSPHTQVEIIKRELPEYLYSIHATTYLKESQRGETVALPIQHGLSVLSKYPIVHSFEYYLPKYADTDEQRSVLCFNVQFPSRVYPFANVHLENKTEAAAFQMKEFVAFLARRNEQRIMAGDVNIPDLSTFSRTTSIMDDYTLSSDVHTYISYPEKNWCLDYIVIPNTFQFLSVEVEEASLSDHKGVFAQINESVS